MAGVLLATVGEQGCFWLNALSYVAVLASLARMDLPKREFFRRGPSLGTGLADGVRYAWATLPLRRLLLLLGVTAGIGFQYQLLLPVYARDILGSGPKVYGLLLTAFGAGALLGALRLTRRPDRSVLRLNLLLGLGACGAGLAVFAWSRAIPLSLAAGALAGFGLIVYVGSTNTLLQLTTEDRYRGRVMSLYTLMFAGTTPIGALGAGAIAQRWGAPVATSVSGGIMLAGAALVAWRFSQVARLPAGRRRRAAQHGAAGVARPGAQAPGAGAAARSRASAATAVPEQPGGRLAPQPRARQAGRAGRAGTPGRGARARARPAPTAPA